VSKFRTRRANALLAPIILVLLAAACVNPALPPIAGPGEPITGVNPAVPTTPLANSTRISYGPWAVPGATGPGHENAGMLEQKLLIGAQKPCGDCFITGFTPQLRYLDGTTANIDTGLWLHHIGLYVFGRTDKTCAAPYPYTLLGERIFSAGNERTRALLPAGAGVRVGAADMFILVYDLMNTGPEAKPVRVEITYDWVPASTPNMHHARAVFLDVSPECNNSLVPGGPGPTFTRARTYPAPLAGRIVGLGGHLHDGGRHITLTNATTGEVICDSVAGYGGAGYEEPSTEGSGHTGHGDTISHLSSLTQCVSPGIDRPIAVLRAGDQISVEAFYDVWDGTGHAHVEDGLMGQLFMYVVEE
jgi:hypothetical protein